MKFDLNQAAAEARSVVRVLCRHTFGIIGFCRNVFGLCQRMPLLN